MKASVIMNCCNEDFNYLKPAIYSYVNQKDVDVQLIVSTIEGDPCVEYIKTNYPSVELCIYPKTEHPGKCPQGSFLQINRALPMMTEESVRTRYGKYIDITHYEKFDKWHIVKGVKK